MARGGWLTGRAANRRETGVRSPVRASRDLPALPRSPEPLSEEALVFARRAAARTGDSATAAGKMRLSIADGADLRAMLDRVRGPGNRREALDQAAQARARLVEQLRAGRAGAALALVGPGDPPRRPSGSETDAELERAMQTALASALDTLRRLRSFPRALD